MGYPLPEGTKVDDAVFSVYFSGFAPGARVGWGVILQPDGISG